MHDRFARILRMIGPEGLRRLSASHVAVIGLGAVGSYATEALARAGVGRLRLVDFDDVRPSNINRQLYALTSTVGQPKVELAAARVRDINPDCQVEPMRAFVHTETMDSILSGPPDLVIDAIDSLTPKVALISAARQRNITLISSMGAALRTDPTAIRVGPLEDVHHCPLAARIRKRLRRRNVPLDHLCVYSTEPVANLPEGAIADDENDTCAEDTHARGRPRRTLGSLPTLTGIFGLIAANAALRLLLKDHFPGAP